MTPALLLTLACSDRGPPPHSEEDPADSPTPAGWQNPAEAEDLDPAAGVLEVRLRAAPQAQQVGELLLDGYAYNGQTPGPTLRARVGDTLVATLDNALDEATTVHWHGLELPYAMDGASWDGGGVAPGAQARVEFALTHAGTFWYHPHLNTDRQVDGGLYGVLIVEDPAEPTPDAELVLVLDDWSAPEAAPAPPPHGGGGSPHGAEGSEGTWAVNGQVQPEIVLDGPAVVRARLVNASNSGVLDLRWEDPRQLASDQGLLPALATPERLILAPGDRAELEWRVGEQGLTVWDHPYSHTGGEALGEPTPLLTLRTAAQGPPPDGLDWPFGGAAPSADPGGSDLVYTFTGDAGTWLINGEAWPDVTWQRIPLGEPRVLELRNLSATQHPFHVHGMAFEVLTVNGVPPPARTVEDTLNLGIRDTVRVLVRPPYAGAWMLHCHILEHAEGGMMTVLEVTE